MPELLRWRTVGGGRVWRLGVALGAARSGKVSPCSVELEIGEMKKPSQVWLLQILRTKNPACWAEAKAV